MKKEINITKPETTSGQLVIKLLKEAGYKIKENDAISYSYDNDEPEASITYNYMSTGIHIDRSSITESDLEDDGIRIYHWASYK